MKNPHVPHKVKDAQTGGYIIILAYRKLSPQEIQDQISTYFLAGYKRPKKGVTITIHTVIS
jgi:hypothetical protein